MTESLEVRNLSVWFRTSSGSVQVVDDLSYVLPAGEVMGIAGESGSGKTVALLAVLGLLPSTATVSGEVWFGDQELLSMRKRDLRAVRGNRIALVLQVPMTSLHPMLSIGTQLTDHIRKHLGTPRKAASREALALLQAVRIPDPAGTIRSFPHQLSGGMRQRVAIAAALACEPEILIADEPTTALDVTVQAGILRLIRELADDRGMSVILVTHDLGVISSLAHRILVMYGGRIAEEGPAEDVLTRPRHPYTRALLEALPNADRTRSRLQPIKGMPHHPHNRPSGCAFHPRCRFAQERCMVEVPPNEMIERDRLLACIVDPYRHEERAAS